MLKRIAGKLTYANVVASLALFLALSGGVVYAAGKIGANQLKANSVTTGKYSSLFGYGNVNTTFGYCFAAGRENVEQRI